MAIRKLSQKEAFYFFTSVGNFIGRVATSLDEFLKEIKAVDTTSLEFHLQRQDFEKWTTDVLKDAKLALEIRSLRNQKFTGEPLRNRLYSVVSRRHKELTRKSTQK